MRREMSFRICIKLALRKVTPPSRQQPSTTVCRHAIGDGSVSESQDDRLDEKSERNRRVLGSSRSAVSLAATA